MPELTIERNQTEGQEPDTGIVEMVAAITDVFSDTFAALIERRDLQYADAIAPLNAEQEALAQEHQSIEADAQNLEGLLESRARVSLYEADCLKLEGKHEEAQAKLAEMEAAKNAPALMRERQRGISARIEAIAGEKTTIAKSVFQEWYCECQHVIRNAEHGLFITLLDGLRADFFRFESSVRNGDASPNLLYGSNHITGLTAGENSEEWQAGTRWYSGRAR